jgi:hypothetical protein
MEFALKYLGVNEITSDEVIFFRDFICKKNVKFPSGNSKWDT